MKLDTVKKRGWAVVVCVWVLISLVAAEDLSGLFGSGSLAQFVFSFVVVSVAPVLPIVHDWVLPRTPFRWAHFALVTAISALFVLLIGTQGTGGDEALLLVLAWWVAFAVAYWLTGDATIARMPEHVVYTDLGWLWGVITALIASMTGTLVGFIVGYTVGGFDGIAGIAPVGTLGGFTIWAFAWYTVRKGKTKLYRWRNLVFVFLVASWSMLIVSLLSPSGFLVGPLVLVFGIAIFVYPQPRELISEQDGE